MPGPPSTQTSFAETSRPRWAGMLWGLSGQHPKSIVEEPLTVLKRELLVPEHDRDQLAPAAFGDGGQAPPSPIGEPGLGAHSAPIEPQQIVPVPQPYRLLPPGETQRVMPGLG